jgi:hypothetical protein
MPLGGDRPERTMDHGVTVHDHQQGLTFSRRWRGRRHRRNRSGSNFYLVVSEHGKGMGLFIRHDGTSDQFRLACKTGGSSGRIIH